MTKNLVVHVPQTTECTVCGWDELTQAAKDISCTTCNGLGVVITDYVSYVPGRYLWMDGPEYAQALSAGMEMGDLVLSVPLRYETLVRSVETTAKAYIVVDGQPVRPLSISKQFVEGNTELRVEAQVVRQEY